MQLIFDFMKKFCDRIISIQILLYPPDHRHHQQGYVSSPSQHFQDTAALRGFFRGEGSLDLAVATPWTYDHEFETVRHWI